MPKPVETIRDDIKHIMPYLVPLTKGAIHGLYTPFLLNTGVERAIKEINEYTTDEIDYTTYLPIALFVGGQTISAFSVLQRLAYYSGYYDIFNELVGTILVTNIIDYLIHAYKRSKESE